MKSIRASQLPETSIRAVYRLRKDIDVSPPYQRQSRIWPTEKKELLVDSILNGMDMPKFYFHEQVKGRKPWAVVDGKQRLETIWEFIEGKYSLAEDFEFFEDEDIKAGGLTYGQLGRKFPDLLQAFDSYPLVVMLIQTNSDDPEDLELIEEMFTRLNQGMTLNAPEKRNASGGPLPAMAKAIAAHPFLSECVWLENDRYRHLDFAAKFLLIEHRDGFTPTKKAALDGLFRNFKESEDDKSARRLFAKVTACLDKLAAVFDHPDRLLSSVGMIIVYYLLFRQEDAEATRPQLEAFDETRHRNRGIEKEIIRKIAGGEDVGKLQQKLDQGFVKFESYSQSLNDTRALEFRVNFLKAHLAK